MAAVTKRPEKFVGTALLRAGQHHAAARDRARQRDLAANARDRDRTRQDAAQDRRLSANAFGFIGNRMLFDYSREAVALAEEGVAPAARRKVMKDFGFPMGPFAMFDLSGIDVSWHIQQDRKRCRSGAAPTSSTVSIELEALGQKTAAGYYKYENGQAASRFRIPKSKQLFAEEAKKAGIAPRDVTDEEIVRTADLRAGQRGAELLRDRRGAAPRRHRHRLHLRLRFSAASRRTDVVRRSSRHRNVYARHQEFRMGVRSRIGARPAARANRRKA